MLFTFKCDEVNCTHEYRDTPDISVNQWQGFMAHVVGRIPHNMLRTMTCLEGKPSVNLT